MSCDQALQISLHGIIVAAASVASVCVRERQMITDWEHHRRPLVADAGTVTSSRFSSWCFHRRR